MSAFVKIEAEGKLKRIRYRKRVRVHGKKVAVVTKVKPKGGDPGTPWNLHGKTEPQPKKEQDMTSRYEAAVLEKRNLLAKIAGKFWGKRR